MGSHTFTIQHRTNRNEEVVNIRLKIPSPQLKHPRKDLLLRILRGLCQKKRGDRDSPHVLSWCLVTNGYLEMTSRIPIPPSTADLAHDLKIINSLYGEFTVTQSYKDAVNYWRSQGEPPTPDHPKLVHYITRRRVHIYKLSMIASINKSSGLVSPKTTSFKLSPG